jgi:hypothetical protein
MVDLHNYPATSSVKAKLSNWITLNNKCLSKLGIDLTKEQLHELANSTANAIEKLLWRFKERVEQIQRDSPKRMATEEAPNSNNKLNQSFEPGPNRLE